MRYPPVACRKRCDDREQSEFQQRIRNLRRSGRRAGGVRNDDTIVANNIIVHNAKYGIFETGSNGDRNRFINNLVFGNEGGDFAMQHRSAATGTIKADPASVFVNWKPDGDRRLSS